MQTKDGKTNIYEMAIIFTCNQWEISDKPFAERERNAPAIHGGAKRSGRRTGPSGRRRGMIRKRVLGRLTSFISGMRSLPEPRKPHPTRLDAITQGNNRRRLDDILEEAFQHACLIGDLATAGEIVELLRHQNQRWVGAHGPDRRQNVVRLARMSEELARRERQHHIRVGGPA